jgi:hypothetical protein
MMPRPTTLAKGSIGARARGTFSGVSASRRLRIAAGAAVLVVACDRSAPAPSMPASPVVPMPTVAAPIVERAAVDASRERACASDEACGWDEPRSTCIVGGEPPYPRDPERAMFCACREQRCELVVVGPFACASWRDCSWTTKPHLRPIPSKEERRPFARPVRPCRDGEVDSVCTENDAGVKVCRIRSWKC